MDKALFESLYLKYFDKVFRFVSRSIQNSDDAEDLTHDVFLKFWNYRASFSDNLPPDAQLLVIARQILINKYKKEALKQVMLNDWELETNNYALNPETPLRESEATRQILVAIDLLPARRKEIFEKSRFQSMTYEEIANEMGLSPHTVESQIRKALKFLRTRLAYLAALSF